MNNIRVGYGYDLHRLEKGTGLMLGGVSIECDKQIVAHSDGDVLLHALCDALLGAAGLGDIGEHFPDSDDQWKDAPGSKLVELTMAKLAPEKYHPVNLDFTVVLETPIITPHKQQMRETIAGLIGMPEHAVNIKATRGEGIGAIGKGEAIAAHCVCLLKSKE